MQDLPGAASAYPDAAAEPPVRQAPVLPAEFCLSNPHAAEPPDAPQAGRPVSDDSDPVRAPGKVFPVPPEEHRFETAAVWEYSEVAAADRLVVAVAVEALPVLLVEVSVRRELRKEHRCPPRDFRLWDAQKAQEAAADQRSPVQDGTRSEHRAPERFSAGQGRPTAQAEVHPDQPDAPVVVAGCRVQSLRAAPSAAEMPDASEAVSWKSPGQRLSALRSPGLPEQVPSS